MHAVECGYQYWKVFFVSRNGNGFVDEAISLGFRNADDGAGVEFHPFGVGFIGIAHVFGLLVAKARAEDFGFIFNDILGGCCGRSSVLGFAVENAKVNEER
jgi:hypothetical protein